MALSRLLVAFLTLALAPHAGSAATSTYYVDCAAGSDSAAGTSPRAAWRTLAKVSATTFLPGDSILLRRGTRCAGQLWPKGSGEPARPILIGAYGEASPLPVIDGSGADAAVKLRDQSHWVVETLETIGGNLYGVFVGGSNGELRDIVLRNLVVHDVTGEPKSKTSGLVVVATADSARMADLVIDGITAFNTTQWAGIIVNGYGATGANRIHNVTVRNSIVHHVAGDGIILFAVEDGVIERSTAWLTGLQPVQTIGTPNAIWTWTCRRCVVRQTEGFFIDSPGVDGGVYDIDFGDDDNVVEDNYGHDAMGYCVAVFGAERLVTTNSVVRGNVCVDNGRSPKLALRQGDLFVYTWDGGSLDGLRIENNSFYWNPVIDAPAVMESADFTGTRPNVMTGNRIFTDVSQPIRSSGTLKLDGNTVARPPVPASAPSSHSARFRFELTIGDAVSDVRSQIVFLQAALAQYPDQLEAVLVTPNASQTIAHDWNLGPVRIIERRRARTPGAGGGGLRLLTADGREVARWERFVPPAELGLTLRRNLGAPHPFN